MNYVIMSGCYETGTEEQKQGCKMLFGEERIEYFFDLYFHWYNVVHEMGHCIVERYGAEMPKAEEEMYVNALAVAYYRFAGEEERLKELKDRLSKILSQFPSPMPEGEDFLSFYKRIWGTEALNNPMIYGYFQFRSVLEALEHPQTLAQVLAQIGIEIDRKSQQSECGEKERVDVGSELPKADVTSEGESKSLSEKESKFTSEEALKIASENAAKFLNTARDTLISLGVDVPEIRVELQKDPMIQCAREDA